LRSVLEGYRRHRCAPVGRGRAHESISCVHYVAKPIGSTEPLATIEKRSADDARLRDFLAAHGAEMPQPPRWSLRSLTLLAFYYHPALDEARAAADVSRGAIVTAGATSLKEIMNV
jgi:hypothetical protein